eukprot:2405865-Pyramimonas_sp.AAC.1
MFERAAAAAASITMMDDATSQSSSATASTVAGGQSLAEAMSQGEQARKRVEELERLVANRRAWVSSATGRLQAYEMGPPQA